MWGRPSPQSSEDGVPIDISPSVDHIDPSRDVAVRVSFDWRCYDYDDDNDDDDDDHDDVNESGGREASVIVVAFFDGGSGSG